MARERKFDLILNNEGYIVAGGATNKPLWSVKQVAAELGENPPMADLPERIETCHLGAGFGHLYVPGCYSYTTNMDCSQPGVITMGPLVTSTAFGATVTGFFEINNTLYGLGGQYCKKITVATDVISSPDTTGSATGRDFSAGAVTTEAIEYNGNIYVGFSSDTAIQKFDATNWTNVDPDTSTATTVRTKYWAKDWIDGYGFRLWKGYATSSVQVLSASANDPMQSDNWASALTIGDTSRSITQMRGSDNIIWVAKEDGLYTIDHAGRFPNVLGSISVLNSTSNGINFYVDGDTVFYPHLMGLIAYDRTSGAAPVVQPFAKTGNTSGIYGRVTAQAKLGHWHYVSVYDGTNSYILKGRKPDNGESLPQNWVGPMMWHPIVKVASSLISCMHITNLTTPARLYFGSGTNVSYIRISKTGDQLSESSMTYATSGSVFLSPINWSAPGVNKEPLYIDIENEGFTANDYVGIYYSLDGGSYTQWGSNATTAGRTRIALPSGTWTTNRLSIEIRATNSSSTATIKIKAVVPRAALRPTYRDVISTKILCMDNLTCRDKSKHRTTGQTMIDNLKGLRDDPPVTLTDYWTGSPRNQTVLVERAEETMIEQVGDDPAGYGVDVVMRVVN